MIKKLVMNKERFKGFRWPRTCWASSHDLILDTKAEIILYLELREY